MVGPNTHMWLLEIIHHLPPVERCVLDLLDLSEDQTASAEDAGRVLMADGVLTGQVLAEANSAAYGSRRAATSAAEAVARLGIPRVASIALNASAMGLFPLGAQPYGLTIENLQEHHRLVAEAALSIGQSLSPDLRSRLATVAVLHDIGKLLLSMASLEWTQHPTLVDPTETDVSELEMQLFSVNHGEVGRMVCDHWDIPESIGLAIEHHHSPESWGFLAHGTLVADAIVHAAPTDDLEALCLAHPKLPSSIAECGFTTEAVERAMRAVRQQKSVAPECADAPTG